MHRLIAADEGLWIDILVCVCGVCVCVWHNGEGEACDFMAHLHYLVLVYRDGLDVTKHLGVVGWR